MTAKRFGASSEKTHNGQPSLFESLFNEAEATAESFAPEPELVTIVEHKRAKSKGKRGANLGGLPENIIEYHPPEDEMVCTCGHQRRVIGQEVSSELHYVSAQISVDVHVQNVYGCRCCGTWGW